ncbi:MAG: sulfate adenylyltransferase subunit CysN [Caldilineaceae bacterium SB0661_bin_32]|uniref:Multifunctional fusion protein n=1 Tax=Caldilineaceae bacterium SB0661_bin_32 TaxID=2605255 RepID=A0A6B1D2A3_9CHLR|nr:sulfate adenylyltransferase subunit CysN [Caldilineaceae bacterium SB0661_bin_32]
MMDLLRFSTAGSVDDGKSTLIGRLLYDSKAIFEDQLEAVEQASAARGDPSVDLALLTDGLRAEREQGITIDVAYRYTATPKRKFIIADTPGHIQYTRNMVTGASTADLAIILVDARKGVLTQSKRHSFIASLLQIPHVVVAVNKMDLVGYGEARYQEIVADYRAFAAKLNVRDVVYIPIAALHGDNIVSQSQNMPWYHGATLLHHLETVNIGAGRNNVDFRLPIQYVIRANSAVDLDFRGFAGQIVSGRIAVGEEVVALPAGIRSRVAGIHRGDESCERAAAGDGVVITLEDEIDISRGDMLVRVRNLPHSSNQLDATLCWMNEEPMKIEWPVSNSFSGQWYWLQQSTRRVRASVQELNYRINVDTMHREDAQTLHLNEIGRGQIVTTEPLFFDSYQINRATGSFILIDPHTNNTVAAGMIRDRARRVSELVQKQEEREAPSLRSSRSSNVVWEPVAVTRPMREELNGHGAAVLWFTGLSGSGKSTVAKALEQKLFALGVRTFSLDGDNVRHGLNSDLGFGAAARTENIRRVAEVARLAFEHGNVVLCTFISPYAEDREAARALAPEGSFWELFVKCDVEICKERDPKGLYERAERGEIPNFTGVSAPYEEPVQPEMVLETDRHSADELAQRILEALARAGIIPGGDN